MKIGDFPIGSVESRAAARASLEARQAAEKDLFAGVKVQFVDGRLDDDFVWHDKRPGAVCTCPPVPRGKIAFCHCLTMEGEIRA